MLKTLLQRLKPRRAARPAADPAGFTPREWADLPTHHPASGR